MVLEFDKSQRGKPKLKHEGYLYCLLREKDGIKAWRCDKRQRKAIETAFEDVCTTRKQMHEPDMKHSEQLMVLENMKERATTRSAKPPKLQGNIPNQGRRIWGFWILQNVGLSQGFIFPFSPFHPHHVGSRSLAFPEIYLDYLGMGNYHLSDL